MKRRWTKDEIEFLRLNYGKKGVEECANVLGRTYFATKHKAVRMNFGSERKNFSKKESEFIKLNYEEKGPVRIAEILNRNIQSVVGYANKRLGIKRSLKAKKRVGEKNSNWRGGITSEMILLGNNTRRKLYPIWNIPILSRDDYSCTYCNSSYRIEVHHLREFIEIRDKVISENPHLSIENDRESIAVLIVLDHKIEDGITLCHDCHKFFHSKKSGELTRKPDHYKDEDNLQPIRGNVLNFVPRQVHRLGSEDGQSNNLPTSARNADSTALRHSRNLQETVRDVV